MISVLRIFFGAEGTRPWLVLICLLASGVMESLSWASIMPLLSLSTGEMDDDATVATQLVQDVFARVGLTTEVGPLVVVIVAAMGLKCLLVIVAMRYIGYTAANVATDVRERLIRGLMAARWDYFTHQPIGRIANAVSTQAARSGNAYTRAGLFVSSAIQTAVYAVVAVLVSWRVALAALGLGFVIAFAVAPLVGYARRAGKRQTDHTSRLVTYLNDALANVKPLKAMERQSHFAQLLSTKIDKLRKALRRQVISKHVMKNVQEFLIASGLGLGFYLATTVAQVPVAQLFFIGALMMRTMLQIASAQQQLQKGVMVEAAYVALQDLVREIEAAREPISGSEPAVFDRMCRLENVTFSHSDTPVLKDASLELALGQVTVVSGPSGSGKTTLTDLILGLYQPEAGCVSIDGVPLTEVDLASWREQIGYVPQEPVLLHDTVRANVALGDSEIDDAHIWAALEAAGARSFVEPLPEQLDTSVGERGARFSGGQRQRIALARALVREPRLLILDEMTAGLDAKTELDICSAVARLAQETAILVITHRDAWNAYAHRRYHLEAGSITTQEQALGE
ncbi:MAG: ABC transporter ATP-binding protein [Deltaproteobacteria bacterium]|nr:ABC transporter ATP-binding protein [Deltaproteobacteria bacterium]